MTETVRINIVKKIHQFKVILPKGSRLFEIYNPKLYRISDWELLQNWEFWWMDSAKGMNEFPQSVKDFLINANNVWKDNEVWKLTPKK